ncbi:major facilitator superfamily domain-containing protein [Penicillium frequentans]|nr:major facilitator superfamily domain-containing protein [Penicillium glabrum]
MPSHPPGLTSESTLADARPEQDIQKDDDAANLQDLAGKPVDRGRDAWVVTFGTWWALFIAFGWTNSFGVLQNYYEKD